MKRTGGKLLLKVMISTLAIGGGIPSINLTSSGVSLQPKTAEASVTTSVYSSTQPIVQVNETVGSRFGTFSPEDWEYSDSMSDEFNDGVLDNKKWLEGYMPWWPEKDATNWLEEYGVHTDERPVQFDEDKEGDHGETGTKYLHLTTGTDTGYWWRQYPAGTVGAKHNNNKMHGIMGGARDYLNSGPSMNAAGYKVQKHFPNQDQLATTYGFFEIRSRLSVGDGIWPAFWFVGYQDKGGNAQNAELDVYELFWNQDSLWSVWTLKNWAGETIPTNQNISPWLKDDAGNSISRDDSVYNPITKQMEYKGTFHTYSYEWAPGYMRFFFDGHLVKEITTNINYRMVPIISFNNKQPNGGSQTLQPNANANSGYSYGGGNQYGVYQYDAYEIGPDPRYYDIDYYRVWKNKNVQEPYQRPTKPQNGENIAAYSYMSLFGLTSSEYGSAPPEILNDGLYTKSVYSGLGTTNYLNLKASGKVAQDILPDKTPLPEYVYTDFYGPVNYDTVVLYATKAQTQAPTKVSIQISETGKQDGPWTTVATQTLDWHTNTDVAEGKEIKFNQVMNNEHMRIVVEEANFNNGRFAINEVEIGKGTKAKVMLPASPELSIAVVPSEQQIPNPFAIWNFENTTPFTSDPVAGVNSIGSLSSSIAPSIVQLDESDAVGNGSKALKLDASKQNYLDLQMQKATSGFDMVSNSNYTTSLWFKIDSLNSEQILLHILGTHMILNVKDSVFNTYFGGGYFNTSLNTKISTDEWHQAAVVYDGSKMTTYLDGKYEATRNTAPSYSTGIRLGASRVGGSYVNGLVDDVAFYQSALTAEQVAWNYYTNKPDSKDHYVINYVVQPETLFIEKGASTIPLPSKVKVYVNQYAYQTSLNVNWDQSAFNSTVPGAYTLSGYLNDPIADQRIYNPNQLKASIVVQVVDKSELRNLISDAAQLLSTAPENQTKWDLNFEVNDAQDMANNPVATQNDVDEAVAALQSAIQTFINQ
jgi:hypothetical protein